MNATSFAELGLRPGDPAGRRPKPATPRPHPSRRRRFPSCSPATTSWAAPRPAPARPRDSRLPILQKLPPHANASPSPARHPVRALILDADARARDPGRGIDPRLRQAHEPALDLSSTAASTSSQQLPIVRGGVEILVATPGRLLDHIEQKSVNLGQVEIFVLDEADRMLDMGFIPDIKRIMALLPPPSGRTCCSPRRSRTRSRSSPTSS